MASLILVQDKACSYMGTDELISFWSPLGERHQYPVADLGDLKGRTLLFFLLHNNQINSAHCNCIKNCEWEPHQILNLWYTSNIELLANTTLKKLLIW